MNIRGRGLLFVLFNAVEDVVGAKFAEFLDVGVHLVEKVFLSGQAVVFGKIKAQQPQLRHVGKLVTGGGCETCLGVLVTADIVLHSFSEERGITRTSALGRRRTAERSP
jgi:hypothetical protein